MAAKQMLDDMGISYENIDIEKEGLTRDDLAKLTGGQTVPQIIINNKVIGGFNELLQLNQSGELKKLANKDNILLVRKNYIEYQYKVTDSPKSRIPAKSTPDYFEDITLDSEKEKLTNRKKDFNIKFYRDQGTGRPTKKDRRIIDKFLKKYE